MYTVYVCIHVCVCIYLYACNAMQCNAMQCNVMQCDVMQSNAMQCISLSVMQSNVMRWNVCPLIGSGFDNFHSRYVYIYIVIYT